MKTIQRCFILVMVLIPVLICSCVPAGPGAGRRTDGNLSNSEIKSGLKEALMVGTVNAVLNVSKKDGYYGRQAIKILLPPSVQQYEKQLRMVGFGSQIDAFEMSMNRAAEKAAPAAKELFLGAIRQMSIRDAKQILFGGENAATLYFKDKTQNQLFSAFKPIISSSMSEVGVTREFQNISTKLQVASLGRFQVPDLDTYVTDLAIEGLFYMVAQEEKKIRENPAARVTAILQKVFGSN
jgi:hypothetical protein